jgi:predicted Ser/Thr protein kinase
MREVQHDLTTTTFVLPPDAKLLRVLELSPRLRAKIGPVDGEAVVVTRPGYRVTTRMVTAPLAALLAEFRAASRITDAIARFSATHEQDPYEILDLSFDALVAFIDGRILVASTSPDVNAAVPSLAAGQAFATLEIERLVCALDDTEVYRARMKNGVVTALKIARDDRAAAMLAHEARLLAKLAGGDTPLLLGHGMHAGRAWLAMEWRNGVPIAVAAQQARAARDRGRLHRLVGHLLEAYARLHARGVVHGDVHPGNVFAGDDDSITILDFGRAQLAEESEGIDPWRTGIAHFHDPQMAAALLAGALPPAASRVAEQYAIATLAYLLLTGLHPIHPAADRSELLARIVARPPLPFPARGVRAWPRVEATLRRALAKPPDQRFADTAEFARAFVAAGVSREVPVRGNPAIEPILAAFRTGLSLSGESPTFVAWLILRAALAWSDAELLAIADVAAARTGDSWEVQGLRAEVARARSDWLGERDAVNGFMIAAAGAIQGPEQCHALLQAARILEGVEDRAFDPDPLRTWAARHLAGFWAMPVAGEGMLHATLALCHCGGLPWPTDLRARLDILDGGSVWLWALAYDAFQEQIHLDRAISAARPRDPLQRGLACLRLHQVTGEMRWLKAARRIAASTNWAASRLRALLLAIEIEAPARAVMPPMLWNSAKP